MRYSYKFIIIIILSLIISLFLYFDNLEFHGYEIPVWKYKEREIKSRLLSIPILLYHNIDGPGIFSIDLNVIKSHFQLIKDRKIRVISLTDLIDRIENPIPFREKVIVITFDDGFYSMYTKLLPLAKEFNFPITLFVYTDFIYKKAKKNLTWNLLREMDRAGIDIQSHSITHSDMTEFFVNDNYINRKKIFEDLYLSKRIIELYLDKKITLFAYPYGRYNLDIIEMSLNSGYRRVFTTDYGSNVITRDNYALRRHHIKKNYSLRFLDKLIR